MRTYKGKEVKNKLYFLRKDIGFAIRDVDKATGICNTTVSMLENGLRLFRQVHIEALCELFQVSPNYLIGNSEEGIIVYDYQNNKIYLSESEYIKLRDKIEITIKSVNTISIPEDTDYKVNKIVYRKLTVLPNEEDMISNLRKKYMNIGQRLTREELEKVIKFIEDFVLYN